MPKVVGILGGMGPEATAYFYRELIRQTPASRDQEHIPVIIQGDPRVPDRTEFLLDNGPSPLPYLLDLSLKLESYGADLIAIPCNTAHYFWKAISERVRIPVLNIVHETVQEIAATIPKQTVGVLATRGTLATALYQSALQGAGIHPVVLAEEGQLAIQSLIQQIKAGENKKIVCDQMETLLQELAGSGANGSILGCTELGLVKDCLKSPLPLFDTVEILARATVREALKT